VLILASASPRRLELLRLLGLEPLVEPADVDETWDPSAEPAAHAALLARTKARTVAARRPEAAVLGADTVVIFGHQVFGKPRDADEARSMLERLSGHRHHVLTAVHLAPPDGADWPAVALTVWTAVVFRALAPSVIAGYVGSGEWQGKAGGYAIQGRAAAFARAVIGSYTNVVGLPLAEVADELERVGLLA
jgi:septum formation protein